MIATKAGRSSKSDIPIDASGNLYTHVFGTTATPFERLVVDRKIMGPCWLNVTAPKINKGEAVSFSESDLSCILLQLTLFAFSSQISWTKLEVEADQANVSPFSSSDSSAPKDIPRLTVLSLSTRTVVNLKNNKREIVCAAGRVWHNSEPLLFPFSTLRLRRCSLVVRYFTRSRYRRSYTYREARFFISDFRS